MAISSQAQRILDAYAATVGGKRDPRYANVINVMQNVPPRTRLLPLLGSMLVLTACTATPSSSLPASISAKEKTINTAIESKPPKRIMDGSKPFTMSEIEERLLKVLALPPAQINKENVEKIFGVVLEGDELPWFFEEISEDKKTVFAVSAYEYQPTSSIFRYRTAVKKILEHDGEEYLEENPREIHTDYKFPYPAFAEKLKALGWEVDGLHNMYGNFQYYFIKDGFFLKLQLDTLRRGEDGQIDYSQSRISRVVLDAPIKR